MKANLRARTVRIDLVKDVKYKDEMQKQVYFTVADRSKTAKTNEDGSKTYVTKGFYFCKMYGKMAELFLKHFSATDDSGKLISRMIHLEVQPEHYQAERKIKVKMDVPITQLLQAINMEVPAELDGQIVSLDKEETIKVNEVVYRVLEFDFDDNKPEDLNEIAGVNQVNISLSDPIPPLSEETLQYMDKNMKVS